ncbi:MAG: serine hydrolase [Pirellulaceae bacterium]
MCRSETVCCYRRCGTASGSCATIHELLTHTSGFTYGWFGPPELDQQYSANQISDLFVPIDEPLADRVARMSRLPLIAEPGSQWHYGVSTDILGRVIEVVSGMSLDRFLYERIFRPLRMSDTSFFVSPAKLERLAALYSPDANGSLQVVGSQPVTAGLLKFTADYCQGEPGVFYSGGGGLVSTAWDYSRFLQMLLNQGSLDDQTILQRETIRQMTTNQIGELVMPLPGHGNGFGYGLGVMTAAGKTSLERAADPMSVGSYSWGGEFNTYFWVDPQEELIGVLMTQVIPYDHTRVRDEFKQLVYAALDDAGFRIETWYEKGSDTANPFFNGRQLRVNSAEASLIPEFADRSEVRSSGMARIANDVDLHSIRKASIYAEIWGGHPGTTAKRLSVNGRQSFAFPLVGSEAENCTHQYPEFHLPVNGLVKGHNSLQFSCEQGNTFWGHFIVDNVAIRINVANSHQVVRNAHLETFTANVESEPHEHGFQLRLNVPDEWTDKIAKVVYQGRYLGFDENGNGQHHDWHGMTKNRQPYGMLGTATSAPYTLDWNTDLLPAQRNVQIRAFIYFVDQPTLVYQTGLTEPQTISPQVDSYVKHVYSNDLPRPFWSRAGKKLVCTLVLEEDPEQIQEARLHVVTWTGGAGTVKDYFTLNGHSLPVAEGSNHQVEYSQLPVDRSLLRKGVNTIELVSDSTHHGIEVMLPGPMLAIRASHPKRFGKAAASRAVDDRWEQGLIGVTHHPRFSAEPFIYTCYVAAVPYPHHRVSRWTWDGAKLDPASELVTNLRRPVDVRFADNGDLYVLLRNAWVKDDKFATGTGSVLRISYVANP